VDAEHEQGSLVRALIAAALFSVGCPLVAVTSAPSQEMERHDLGAAPQPLGASGAILYAQESQPNRGAIGTPTPTPVLYTPDSRSGRPAEAPTPVLFAPESQPNRGAIGTPTPTPVLYTPDPRADRPAGAPTPFLYVPPRTNN